MEKKLGKITKAYFGIGGYQNSMIGLHLEFSFDGCGTATSRTAWDAELVECGEYSKWTEEDRSKQYDEIVRYVSKLLNDAKCKTVGELIGKPVEVTLEGMTFKEFRILTEVL